jgi:hypothetical protein
VYNKIDSISLEQVDKLARSPHTVVISCELDLNLSHLIDRIWEELGLVRVYTKKRGAHPDLSDPVCMRRGATVEVRARARAVRLARRRAERALRRTCATASTARSRPTSATRSCGASAGALGGGVCAARRLTAAQGQVVQVRAARAEGVARAPGAGRGRRHECVPARDRVWRRPRSADAAAVFTK